jgi:hypothetical protein
MTKQADAKRLYSAVERMCNQAGTDTHETVEWLCGSHSGMLKLFTKYFSPDSKSQSFGEKYPPNPNANCKCEHWQACIDCHPTYINAAMKGEV